MINLQVLMVKLLGSPGPTLVCALSCSTYVVLGDNPSTVPISLFDALLPKLSITVSPYWIEYCVIIPLGVSGGSHCNVTELEVTETTSNEHGSLGTESNINIMVVVSEFSIVVATYVCIYNFSDIVNQNFSK